LRRLRIAASVQLPLPLPAARTRAEEVWPMLPEAAQAQVLTLLARLIARGVLDEEEARG
jgi:hypothetical protein